MYIRDRFSEESLLKEFNRRKDFFKTGKLLKISLEKGSLEGLMESLKPFYIRNIF